MLSLNRERFFSFKLFPSEKKQFYQLKQCHLRANCSATYPGPANNVGIYTANHFNLPTALKLSDQAENINLNPVTNGH